MCWMDVRRQAAGEGADVKEARLWTFIERKSNRVLRTH